MTNIEFLDKSLLLEVSSLYIVVGIVDKDLNVISSNNIESHTNLINRNPLWYNRNCYNWRFNANNNTLYWYNDPTEDMISVVKDEIKKKYPQFRVLKQHRINSNDTVNYNKKQRLSHGLDRMEEIYPNNARFGIGAVDSYGAVNFKEFNRDIYSSQSHGRGNPYGRYCFRYEDGIVEWSDSETPDEEIKHLVDTALERKGFPVKKHTTIYDNMEETYRKDYSSDDYNEENDEYFKIGQEDEETTANSFCWMWSQSDQGLRVKQGKTHGFHFSHEIAGNTFKGWYDPFKKAISVVFPPHELRKLGDKKPTVDDIPTNVYNKLISKFGKTNRFVVFESIKKSQLKQIIKEIVLMLKENTIRGEWWFQDGQAIYADGDVGDMNHEGYVLETLRRQVLNALDVDSSRYDFIPELSDLKSEIFQSIGEELNPQELELWNNDDINEVIISYLSRNGEKNIKDIIYYIRGHDDKGQTLDIRNYALVHWGWQRVVGRTIQTQTLTSGDLNNIIRGLYEAYGDELEETDEEKKGEDNPNGEQTFNIEVMSTRSLYSDIPISVLEKKNSTSLNPYRKRYEESLKRNQLKLLLKEIVKEVKNFSNENMTYDELLKLTTDDRKERAANVNARSLDISMDEGNEQWNFRYKSSPTTTVTDKPFRGAITFLKGEFEEGDDATKLECKVDCGCPDFMYRFAYNDADKGASKVGRDSLSGCLNRRPKPAYDYGVGLCKHLIALGRFLKTKIETTRKSNLFEAINEVAKRGPFKVTYYD